MPDDVVTESALWLAFEAAREAAVAYERERCRQIALSVAGMFQSGARSEEFSGAWRRAAEQVAREITTNTQIC